MNNRRRSVKERRLAALGTGLAALLLITGCGGEPAVDEEMDYDQPIVAEGDLVESESTPPETDQLVPAPTDTEQGDAADSEEPDSESPAEAESEAEPEGSGDASDEPTEN